MKNVDRPAEPELLRRNGAKWTDDLMRGLAAAAADGSTVRQTLYERYRMAEIRDSLRAMYRGLCAYCEATVGVVDYPHIEHRKPKKPFPGQCYAWSNLHLSCTKCNTHKGDRWDATAPILDAVVDVPIDQHLLYKLTGGGVLRDALTPRGKTTVDHTDLNRDELQTARASVLLRALQLVKDLGEKGQQPAAVAVRAELDQMERDAFGSLIRYARQHYGH
jgi:uncharacterized protein (TIGR02646 family)